MSAIRPTVFEVVVKRKHEEFATYHFEKRHPQQAIDEGKRYGKVVHVRKAHFDQVQNKIEQLVLDQTLTVDSPYTSAINMDEFIWKKRQKRIKNAQKDKDSY